MMETVLGSGLRLHDFEPEFVGPFHEGPNLLLPITRLVIENPFINILLAVANEAVEQACQLSSHSGYSFWSTEARAQTPVLGTQVTLTA